MMTTAPSGRRRRKRRRGWGGGGLGGGGRDNKQDAQRLSSPANHHTGGDPSGRPTRNVMHWRILPSGVKEGKQLRRQCASFALEHTATS